MDYQLEQWVNGPAGSGPALDTLMRFVAEQGALLFIGLVVAWLLYALVRGVRDEGVGACMALLAAGIGFGVNQVLALAWDRPRPFAAHPHSVHLLVTHAADSSFPSDHAAAAFAIAAVLASCHRRLGLAFLVLAAAIGYARVYIGVHYPGDVLAGAIVGVGAALLVPLVARRPLQFAWAKVAALRNTDG